MEQEMKLFCEKSYQKECIKINERIYYFKSYGHSNATAIIGDTSVILIDTLDTNEYAQDLLNDLKKITDKPVKTLIYTHGHPDHRGGAGTFKNTVTEIIAFTPIKKPLKYYDRLNDILNKRGSYQHGYNLNDEEAIFQGIGIREGKTTGHGCYEFMQPTTIYQENKVERVIDGVALAMYRAPGETDNQICIWLKDNQVICTGDNYYGVFPALYAIRGTQYRDLATWIESLELILSFPSKVLLPGHTDPIIGHDLIEKRVGDEKEAIEYILFHTLQCMNQGLTLQETVAKVRLPDRLSHSPYLQEYYGMVEWAVKSVYVGYVGWFDGNPVHLLPVKQSDYDHELLTLIGKEKLNQRIKELMTLKNYQMALQLLELVDEPELKKECLLQRARQVKSVNARHYLISCAKEINKE